MKLLLYFTLVIGLTSNSLASPNNLAVAAYNSGASAFNSGDYKTAIIAYSNAIKLEPELLQAWINLADSYLANFELEKAFESVNKAISLEKNSSEAFRIKGMIYLAKKSYLEAIDAFNSALNESKPNFAAIYYSRGHALASIGETDKAISDTKKALEYAPLDVDLLCNLVIFFARKSDYNNTVKYLYIAREIDPEHPKVKKLLSDFLNAEKMGVKNDCSNKKE